jgi:hypothetical protein
VVNIIGLEPDAVVSIAFFAMPAGFMFIIPQTFMRCFNPFYGHASFLFLNPHYLYRFFTAFSAEIIYC